MSENHNLEKNKNLWMPGEAGWVTGPKRSHPWLIDASEPGQVNNKKQALESVYSRPISGTPIVNISSWRNASNFQSDSGLFSDRIYGPGHVGTYNFAARNMFPFGASHLNIERSSLKEQVGGDSSIRLSMSRAVDNPSSFLSYGVTKSPINQVIDSNNGMSIAMGHSYIRGENHRISLNTTCSKIHDSLSLGPICSESSDTTCKAKESFNQMGQDFNKDDGTFMLMGQNYNLGNFILSTGKPFDKEDENYNLINQPYEKGNVNIISMGSACNRGPQNVIAMDNSCNKATENFISSGPTFDIGNDTIPVGPPSHNKVNTRDFTTDTIYNKGDSSIASMGHKYNKGKGSSISLEGFRGHPEANSPSGRFIRNNDLLMRQLSVKHFEEQPQAPALKESTLPISDTSVNAAELASSTAAAIAKTKVRKNSEDNFQHKFPSNVKSLLSTGILDDVPVKYVSWSREKSLLGIIEGASYRCGCKDCKGCKTVNAYEFERHAGCNTKHPNNHIYFENGKSIYAVVHELRSTPENKLFEAIESVTGSPINQQKFRVWKVAYEAAAAELRRIYQKEEAVKPLNFKTPSDA